MAGISSKALAFGNPEHKYKYNDKELQEEEFSDGSGLEAYDFNARTYDPQIGRMWQIDPWTEKYERQSPYASFNNNPIIFADPTGKGGVLTVEQRPDGSFYLKVTSKIYVYSKNMSMDDVKGYASKIQDDIKSQWNDPVGKGYGEIGISRVDVVFDVSVEGVTMDQAEEYANGNRDVGKNFMSLDGTSSSVEDGSNSGEFSIQQLNERGSTTAAHEFGHMLGYNIDKKFKDGSYHPDIVGDNGHAWKIEEEKYFIMGGYSIGDVQTDAGQRRVHAIEYTRLGGGIERRQTVTWKEGLKTGFGGIYTPTNTTNNIPIVNPDKPLSNKIFK